MINWQSETPSIPGWYYAWRGTRGMNIIQILKSTPNQCTVLGGRWDGANLIQVGSLGVRLWAGPLDFDPHKENYSNFGVPILPSSEYDILNEWKNIGCPNDFQPLH